MNSTGMFAHTWQFLFDKNVLVDFYNNDLGGRIMAGTAFVADGIPIAQGAVKTVGRRGTLSGYHGNVASGTEVSCSHGDICSGLKPHLSHQIKVSLD